VSAVVEVARFDLVNDRRPEKGGMFDIGFGDRKAEGFAASDSTPHEHDTNVAAVNLNPFVFGQLGF
jgi:hypothetical protein